MERVLNVKSSMQRTLITAAQCVSDDPYCVAADDCVPTLIHADVYLGAHSRYADNILPIRVYPAGDQIDQISNF